MAKKDIKFPSISRIINDKNLTSLILGTIFILIAITILGFDLKKTYIQNKLETQEKKQLLIQRNFWLINLSKYPDFRDGYLALSKIDYELGFRQEASEMVQKAIYIDPNYEISIKIQRILEGN